MKTYTHINVYIYIRICIPTSIYICIYLHININTCIYTYTYIHIYTHSISYVYIHIHLYVYIFAEHDYLSPLLVPFCFPFLPPSLFPLASPFLPPSLFPLASQAEMDSWLHSLEEVTNLFETSKVNEERMAIALQESQSELRYTYSLVSCLCNLYLHVYLIYICLNV